MPELSRFLGIVICMYYRERPPPHFHAEYGEFEITVEIDTGVITGKTRGGRSTWSWSGTLYTGRNWPRTGLWLEARVH